MMAIQGSNWFFEVRCVLLQIAKLIANLLTNLITNLIANLVANQLILPGQLAFPICDYWLIMAVWHPRSHTSNGSLQTVKNSILR